MLRLNDDDSRAVDTILDLRASGKKLADHEVASADAGGAPTLPTNVQTRLKTVTSLLGLLEALPADDPPGNLVIKTLRAVENHAQLHAPEPWPFGTSPDLIDDLRPQA
jgi:hypothetical protein